nr:hypothetical protein [Tanacetum cinerariifolium]
EPKTYKDALTQSCWIEAIKKSSTSSNDLSGYPMVEKSKLDEDKERKAVDSSHYRGLRKHIHAVKRIFRYLRGTVNWGLWYPKDSSVALTAFADADHAGCKIHAAVHLVACNF